MRQKQEWEQINEIRQQNKFFLLLARCENGIILLAH